MMSKSTPKLSKKNIWYFFAVFMGIVFLTCFQIQYSYAEGPNSFNRLMKPKSKRNPAPAQDGIHDSENDGTHILQPPKEQFSKMPGGKSGNYIDWVKALEEGKINPDMIELILPRNQ